MKRKIFWECVYCHKEIFGSSVGRILGTGRIFRMAHNACVKNREKK